MNKSRKNNKYKNKNNKTKKYPISFLQKKKFVNNIIKEWVKQTNGSYAIDKTTKYKNDYYLSFGKKGDYYNHIHIVLNPHHINDNNLLYVMKKYNIKTKNIEHSNIKISILSDPSKAVRNMIQYYAKFIE
jgi:hypothetical protein